MVPFAGWEMPVSYGGTVGEVAAVRSSAGLFDVSHMGEVIVTGAGAFDFVQFVTTNDISKLVPGKAQYSLLLNEAGGVIDDILVYCRAENDYLIVLNAGCKDKDWDWLQTQAQGRSDVHLTDISDETALIAVQGPNAVELVASLHSEVGPLAPNNGGTGKAISPLTPPLLGAGGHIELYSQIKRFHFASANASAMPLTLSRTGYTGEDGFEIFCQWEDAPRLWQELTERGAVPAGLGARDVLRLEAAYTLYGHELDTETSPLESGVGWAVKMGKGDFIGREALQNAPSLRQIVGLRMDERAIPREHYAVYETDGPEIGQTTSGTWSPTLKAGIAMARLGRSHAEPGTRVTVDIRGRRATATVVPLPFYRNGV